VLEDHVGVCKNHVLVMIEHQGMIVLVVSLHKKVLQLDVDERKRFAVTHESIINMSFRQRQSEHCLRTDRVFYELLQEVKLFILQYFLLDSALVEKRQSLVLLKVSPHLPLNQIVVVGPEMLENLCVFSFSFLKIVLSQSVFLGVVDDFL